MWFDFLMWFVFFFFKQKTAYELRISDWSSTCALPISVILLQVNWILTGVVVVEAIFAYPGIGSLLLKAALFGDIYVVQALTLLALAVAVGTQFVGDVAYMLLDPKIRLR